MVSEDRAQGPGAAALDVRKTAAVDLSRRQLLALGATIVVGGCSSDDKSSSSTTGTNATTSSGPSVTTAGSSATTGAVTTSPAASSAPVDTAPEAPSIALGGDPFGLGVCSGDPDDASAVLWTRLVADGADELPRTIEVTWELADDSEFASVVAEGTVEARREDAHSVHALVELSGPAWYRFRAGGFVSPVGKVAPTGAPDPLRVATASCQHFEYGFYAAHRDLAEWTPDLVLYLGDFIYENPGAPDDVDRIRTHEGDEAIDLAGYRERYRQYLGDGDLQAARAACPWLVIWDDHEVENNYAGPVPDDIVDTETFAVRRAEGYRAWWEHMPVRLPPPPRPPDPEVEGDDTREPEPYPIHRTVAWGGLASFTLLDGRQFRSDQACDDRVLDPSPPCPESADPARTMLGEAQERFAIDALGASSATWTVLAQQTVMTDIRLPNGAILNHDQWDGYAPARDRLLAAARTPERVVVLTGDIHLAGIGVLPEVGVEFVTTSISSPANVDESLTATLAGFANVVDAEIAHRGYTRHTITEESWTAEYRIVDDVRDRRSPVTTWRTFVVDATTRDAVTAI